MKDIFFFLFIVIQLRLTFVYGTKDLKDFTDHYLARFRQKYDILYKECPRQRQMNIRSMEAYRKYPYELWYHCGNEKSADVVMVVKNSGEKEVKGALTGGGSDTKVAGNRLCETAFNPESFLSLLRGKSIGVYGDSLARQLFNGIIANVMLPHQTAFYRNDRIYINHYFEHHDVNISYCEDGFGAMAAQYQDGMNRGKSDGGREFSICLKPMIESVDFLIVGVAAWFKPYFSVGKHVESDFYKNGVRSAMMYAERMTKVREFVKNYPYPLSSSSSSSSLSSSLALSPFNSSISSTEQQAPPVSRTPPKVIWRLSPHASNCDEVNYLNPSSDGKDSYDHWNGEYWTLNYTRNNALWVPKYNQILRNISHTYHDRVLDWFSLSMVYMEKHLSFGVSKTVHSDSLHYCLEGLPLATNLLLYQLLKNY
jgi:hypothetical protein